MQRILRGHPNIVNLVDSAWNRLPDGRYEGYILMEYCSGQPISLRRRPESTYGYFMCSSTYREEITVAKTYISTGSQASAGYLVPVRRSVQVGQDTVLVLVEYPFALLPSLHTRPMCSTFGTAQCPDSAQSHSRNGIPDIFALL